LAKSLIKKFGEEGLIKQLDKNPKMLLEYISEDKLQKVLLNWEKFKSIRELSAFLSPFGVSQNIIIKIFQQFGHEDNLITKLKDNPYITTDIKGIGFSKADDIAMKLGVEPKSRFRVGACIEYILKNYADAQGNSSMEIDKLFIGVEKQLEFSNRVLFMAVLSDLNSDERVVFIGENKVALSYLYFCESQIKKFLKVRKELYFGKILKDIEEFIYQKELEIGFALGEEQKEVIRFVNSGISTLFLVGYAGSGKTTLSKIILELLSLKYGDSILCMALSGIASQKIYDTTGFKSYTIQSLILKHESEFPSKVILLDEASMVNSPIFYQIIKRIPNDRVFIVLGDDAQLPAIGAGNILGDVLNFSLSNSIKLTKIYRQKKEQAIATIANSIRHGVVPDFMSEYEDFKFINVSISDYFEKKNSYSQDKLKALREENSENILSEIKNIAKSYADLIKYSDIPKYINSFQLITPMRAGVLGSDNLNIELQNIFNKDYKKSFKSPKFEFRVMDKVVHIKNDNMNCFNKLEFLSGEKFEKKIFNGMVGVVFEIDLNDEFLYVYYPNEEIIVEYNFDELLDYLQLAYSLTIHKTQGMEYDTVVIPITFSHYIIHNTQLLYTAITRAKKMCYIVGEESAFKSACKRVEVTKRESVMRDLCSLI